MAEDEYARAKLEEHGKRLDRHENMLEKQLDAMDASRRWQAKHTVYVMFIGMLVAWIGHEFIKNWVSGWLSS